MSKQLVIGLVVGGVIATAAGAFALRSNSTTVADVISVTPITAGMEQQYATVVKVDKSYGPSAPPMATVVDTQPIMVAGDMREVCVDRVVTHQAPAKDENQLAGTAAGAVIGGALGNQVGGGNGKKAATVIGAIAGGLIGKNIQEKRQQANTYETIEQQCHTEQGPDKISGYNATLDINGQPQTVTLAFAPKSELPIVDGQVVTDKSAVTSILAALPAPTYNVTYELEGKTQTITLDKAPEVGAKVPYENGQPLTTPEQLAALKARENNVVAYQVLYQSEQGMGQARMLQPPQGQTLELKRGKPVLQTSM